MRIFAVILNWKRPEETIACVRSVQETAHEVHIVVVDNASGDGSAEKIRAALADIELIENPTNAGYAGGNNVGIKMALHEGADAILVLNNDVVVQPGCIRALADKLRDESSLGIVAPVSLKLEDPTVVDFYRAEFDKRYFGLNAVDRGTKNRPTQDAETDYATGSALLIRAETLRVTGLFDEKYFLVWEDVDFCLRAREAGFHIGVVARAEVLHGGSISFGGAGSPLYQYFYVRNSFLLMRKCEERSRSRGWSGTPNVLVGGRRAEGISQPRFGAHVRRWLVQLIRPNDWRMLRRRYRGWIAQSDGATKRAIERGLDDGLHGRFGPPPSDLAARFDS